MSTWTSMQGRGSVQSRLTSVAQSHGTAVEHNELGCPCWVEKLWSWLGRESFVLVTYMWVVVSARLHIMLGCMRPYRPTVPKIGQRRPCILHVWLLQYLPSLTVFGLREVTTTRSDGRLARLKDNCST